MVNKYKYIIENDQIKLISTDEYKSVPDQTQTISRYKTNQAQLIADWKSGELTFESNKPMNVLFSEIDDLIKISNVKALVRAEFINEDDLESVIRELGGDSILMINEDTINVHVTLITKYLKLGYIPKKREYREYPIVVDPSTYKILFTCEWWEIKRYKDDGKMVIVPKL